MNRQRSCAFRATAGTARPGRWSGGWAQGGRLLGIGLGLAMSGLFAGCRRAEPITEDDRLEATAERPPVEVSVARAGRGRIAEWIALTGEVRARASVALAPKVSGRLERLAVERDGAHVPLVEGLHLKAGEVYARVDTAIYEQRYRQALAAARMAEAQWEEAVREEARVEALLREGSATEQMRDRAATARRVAEAARAQAEATLRLAEIEFAESMPRAPMDGVITRKMVDPGNLVQAGTPLALLEDVGRLRVLFGVPERYADQVHEGRTRVRIRPPGDATPEIEAVVARRHPTADPVTRNVMTEVELEGVQGLKPGNFVHVRLETRVLEDALLVPARALRRGLTGEEAWVVEDGHARLRPVRVGIRDERFAEVLDGVREGERVVVEAAEILSDGRPVVVRGEATP